MGTVEEAIAAKEFLDNVEDALLVAETIVIDTAVELAFDEMDINDDGVFDQDEAEDMMEDLGLDDEEIEDFYETMEYADADENGVVTFDELYSVVWEAVEEDAELRAMFMQEMADWIDELDVDCSEDGIDGCDDEREQFRREIDEYVAADMSDE
jgi:hypothetical protein